MERLVKLHGAIYKMSESELLRMLNDYALGKNVILSEYGKRIEVFDFTLTTIGEAAEYVASLLERTVP